MEVLCVSGETRVPAEAPLEVSPGRPPDMGVLWGSLPQTPGGKHPDDIGSQWGLMVGVGGRQEGGVRKAAGWSFPLTGR